MRKKKANRQYKDRLFKFVFSKKKYALQLFNLLTDSNYTNEDELQITTLKDSFFMSMKNDLSILVHFTQLFAEQQSTRAPNSPLRLLLYSADSMKEYIEINDIDLFSSRQVYIPKPYFFVIYNGREEEEDIVELKLSDGYKDPINEEQTLELRVKQININPGHNEELLKKCRPLYEYAWMCGKIREREEELPLTERIENMLKEIPKEFELYDMIKTSSAEVIEMLSMEYDVEKHIEKEKDISYYDGLADGIEEGEAKGEMNRSISIAKMMLSYNEKADKIAQYTGLSKEQILELK